MPRPPAAAVRPGPAAGVPFAAAAVLLSALFSTAAFGQGGGDGTADSAPADRRFAVVRDQRFAVVKDDTLGVRPEEADLSERVLDEVRAADPDELAGRAAAFERDRREELGVPQGRAFPTFVDLFQHPTVYRGEPVTLTGQARVIREYPAGPSAADPGEPRVEVWLFTDDGQTNPAVVVAAAAPGLPRGDDLLELVRVTGVFFKRYGYRARDTTRVAPLILAATVEPVRAAEPPPVAPVVLTLAAVVTVLGLSAGLWAWWLRPRRRRGPRAVSADGGEAPDLGGFAPEPVDDEPAFPRD